MAYLRSIIFQNSFKKVCQRNNGETKRYMAVVRELTSSKQADRVQVDDANKKSKPNVGVMKQNLTLTKPIESVTRSDVDIIDLVRDDMKDLFEDIRKELTGRTSNSELLAMANYYFDGKGKAIRPIIASLMGKSLNFHISDEKRVSLSPCQRQVAMITEMSHTASLMHDDLLDGEELRRGNPSMVSLNHQKVARAGDFVIGTISSLVARLNYDAGMILYKMSRDLALGELLQLDSPKSQDEDMFSRYLTVIHLKAAVLFASACEAQAVLASADYFLREGALQYGRNIGMAFQLADDFKDFKIDLSQGIITAPVLLASRKYPKLQELILRKFCEKDDLERAFDFVYKAQGLEETKKLVQLYCREALRHASLICESPYQDGLKYISEMILNLINLPEVDYLNHDQLIA